MLTSYPDEQAMLEAFMAGAAGFVLKDITGLDLVAAVRAVGSGRSLLDPRAAAVLFDRFRTAPPTADPLAVLTAGERTTMELIGQGLTNRQIAGRMLVAEKTVKNNVSHLPCALVQALAAAAGVAVDSARLYGLAERRQRWLLATAEIAADNGQDHDQADDLVARAKLRMATVHAAGGPAP